MRYKEITVSLLVIVILISVSFFSIGGCGGGGGEDNEEIIQVSGEIVVFSLGLTPVGSPIPIGPVVGCGKLFAEDGNVYLLIENLSGFSISDGTFITALLSITGKKSKVCGGILAILIDVIEKRCPRSDDAEDLCQSPGDLCCPLKGCAPDLNSCPTPDCMVNEKPCGPFCVGIDDVCCPEPKSLSSASCPADGVCCPDLDCGFQEVGNHCAETLEGCTCISICDFNPELCFGP